MQHPDEGMIHTWLDGQLSAGNASALEAHVVGCRECAAMLAEARGLIAASSGIVSSLDSVPRGVIPNARPASRHWYATTQFRAAAALLFVAGTSLVVVRGARQARTEARVDKPLAVLADSAIQPSPAPTPRTLNVPAAPMSAKGAVTHSPMVAASAAGTDAPRSDVPLDQAAAKSQAAQKSQALMQVPALSGKVSGVTITNGVAVGEVDKKTEGSVSLKVVRSDSSSGNKQTVFETQTGVRVRLTELEPSGFGAASRSTSVRALAVPKRPTMISVPPRATNESAIGDATSPIINSITWSDPATGRSYILSGPLATGQLEALKPMVVKIDR